MSDDCVQSFSDKITFLDPFFFLVEPVPEPQLLGAFIEFVNLESLENVSKAALRLCNRRAKKGIDATVTVATLAGNEAVQVLERRAGVCSNFVDLKRAEY